MKFNKQKIDEVRAKINKAWGKITNNSQTQIPKKYYGLLCLMLILGGLTLTNNIARYNKSKAESYTEYKLEEKPVNAQNINIATYQIAQSSINTEISNTASETVETISSNTNNNTGYIMPVAGEIIKEFAVEKLVYSATLGMWKTHPGIDIKTELGEDVKASTTGIVNNVYMDSFYGNTIEITDEKGYTFVYGNLDTNIVVKEGDKVEQGRIIGTVGVTAAGELADQTHLHFEILKDGTQVNPLDLIN